MHILNLTLFATLGILLILEAIAAQAPEVRIANGVVRGLTTSGPNGKKVYVFYGIPFAKPPIGELRFKRPVPYTEKWDKPRDATKRPNTCAQSVRVLFPDFSGEAPMNPNTPISEDCLYLNVYVPVSMFRKSTNVYFWIYGGAFVSGTSTLDMYSGVNLASEKDVIVVSIQYRVGAMGFLYLGTEDAPGNQGLLDQQLALQWVNDNIKSFGGDPAEITIMGESAGAASVSHHLLTPGSRNLFKRAIMMSGCTLSWFAFTPPTKMLEIGNQLIKDAGCQPFNPIELIRANWNSENTSKQAISCLRKLSMEQILKAGAGVRAPTIDGYFLPEEPAKLLKKWDIKRAEVMIGDVKNEGNSFILESFPKHFDPRRPTFVPYDGYLAIMKQVFTAFGFSEAERDAIIYYYTNWINKDDGYANQQKLGDSAADYLFNCPHRDFADQWSARGLKTYSYFLTHRTESSPWGKWMGVRHTDDIVYFFGQPIGNSNYTKAEQDLSKNIIDLVASFARTGSPSQNWKPYTREFPYYMNMNATVITDKTSGLFGPRPSACAFWNVLLPQIRKLEAQKMPDALPSGAVPVLDISRNIPIVGKLFLVLSILYRSLLSSC